MKVLCIQFYSGSPFLLHFRINKREKYSRRRPYDEAADIDYINERNMKFNRKLERFYGKNTAEIKQNLERGTTCASSLCLGFQL